jgi:anti-anti-sigma factor
LAAKAELKLLQAPGELLGRTYPLEQRPLTVGRAPDCDIRLMPRSISRYHAKLVPAGPNRWKVEDAGSQNGIDINGNLVRAGEVTVGDRIGFGTEIVAVVQAVAAPAPPVEADLDPTTHTAFDALVVQRNVSAFHPRVSVLRMIGRIDGYSYAYLRDEIGQVIDEGGRFLIADLTQCSYCDHAGLGVLVNVQVTLRQRRGGLYLIGVSGQLRDAFALLRLDQVLSVAADEQTAARELGKLAR